MLGVDPPPLKKICTLNRSEIDNHIYNPICFHYKHILVIMGLGPKHALLILTQSLS